MLMALRHDHVVNLFGIMCDPRTRLPNWLVMERADGSLPSYLAWCKQSSGGITMRELTNIALDVLEGMDHLHSMAPRPYIHR